MGMDVARHIAHLLARCWAEVLRWQGTTTFSVVREAAIPVVILLVVRWWDVGWEFKRVTAMGPFKEELRRAVKTITVLLAVAGVVFLAAIPVVIYQDHKELVESRSKAVRETAEVKRENHTLQTAANDLKDRLAKREPQSGTVAPKSIVHVEPGGAYSARQQGGITVGTVNNTYQGPHPPEFTYETLKHNELSNDSTDKGQKLYETAYRVIFNTQVPIGMLSISVTSALKSIRSLQFKPEAMSTWMGGVPSVDPDGSGGRGSINSPVGNVAIIIKSAQPDKFNIVIGCSPTPCTIGPRATTPP
jgi:cell division protein FtsB